MTTRPSSGSQGSVIRPFRSQQRLDQTEANNIWMNLKGAIEQIYNKNASTLSFEELYRNAYNLVLYKHGEMLYKNVEGELISFLKKMALEVSRANDQSILSSLVGAWQTHTTTVNMIKDILMYMDRAYVVPEKKSSVFDLGMELFCKHVARHPDIQDRVLQQLLHSICAERAGELIPRDEISKVVSMMVVLKIYESDFEDHFLRLSNEFYSQEAIQYLDQNTVAEYLIKVDKRLTEEKLRAQSYLTSSTEAKIVRVIQETMIHAHADNLVGHKTSGCHFMFNGNKNEDLHRMYTLFNYKDGHNVVQASMTDHIKELGLKLVDNESAKPNDFIEEMLKLHDKYTSIIHQSFENDKFFQKGLNEAFKIFVNKNHSTSQNLASYLDQLMRKRSIGSDEMEMNNRIDNCISLFRYIDAKDAFEVFYKERLAKRLLNSLSSSEDAEMVVIKKLKSECGQGFTSKLEGMFKDIKLSKKTMEEFATNENKPLSDIILHVSILTAGFWPTEAPTMCVLPPILNEKCETFVKFYNEIHHTRKVTWQSHLGSAKIKATYPPTKSVNKERVHEFHVSTYQLVILLLLDERGDLPFKDILAQTGMNNKDLERHILSLCTPRCNRILLKDTKSVEPDTKFSVNENYTNQSYFLSVPLISSRQKNNGADQTQLPKQVEEDRKHLIEATIVRIMKSRKTMKHNLLVAEVTKQLTQRFRPTPQGIKKRIESLIEREYLARQESDRNEYAYLA